jgi:hypothetical protein
MPAALASFVASGSTSPGVFLVIPQSAPIRDVVTEAGQRFFERCVATDRTVNAIEERFLTDMGDQKTPPTCRRSIRLPAST